MMGRPLGSKDKKPRSAETRIRMSAAKTKEKNPAWRGGLVSYRAAHSRIQREKGKACTHFCACGQQAHDWSNLSGNFADPNDYAAMCRKCHRRFDKFRLQVWKAFKACVKG